MNTRIKQLRRYLNMTLLEFGDKIGIAHSTLSQIETNKLKINDRIIYLICSKFNVNENWLRTGEGDIFITLDVKYEELFNIYKDITPVLQDFLLDTAKNLLNAQNKL